MGATTGGMSEPDAGDLPQATDSLPAAGGVDAPEVAGQTVPTNADEWAQAIDGMDSEQLAALLSAPAASLPPVPDVPAETVPDAVVPDAEKPAGDIPPAEPASALDHPASPSRIRLTGLSEEQRQRVVDMVDALKSGKAPVETSTAAVVVPPADSPAESAPAVPVVPAVPEVLPAIAELEGRVAATSAALEQARADFDTMEVSRLTLELVDLKGDLRDAKAVSRAESARAAESASAYDARFDANVASLLAEFPDLGNEESAICVRLNELRDLQTVRDPGAQDSPDFIVALARQAAADVSARPATQVSAGTAIPRHRPVGVVGTGGTVSAGMSRVEAERSFDRTLAGMTEEQQREFLSQVLPIPA